MHAQPRIPLTVLFILVLSITLVPGKTRAASYDWSKVQLSSTSGAPEARVSPVMVYDYSDGYILLFGGWDKPNNYLSDTWRYESNTWTKLSPATSPSARYSSSAAYDASDGYVVVYGGEDSSGNALNETWTFQNDVWTQEHPAVAPSPRVDASMVYDAADGYILLYGGTFPSEPNAVFYNDTWTYKAGRWTQLHPATGPMARGAAAMAYDPSETAVILFGGSNDYYTVDIGLVDTWKIQAGEWTELHPSGPPDHRDSLGLVYDPAQAGLIFYGGWDPGGICGNDQNDTRIFRTGVWRQLTPPSSAGPRAAFGLDYDPSTSSIILFGGQENPGASPQAGCGTRIIMGDTWEYGLARPSNTVNASLLPMAYGVGAGLAVAGAVLGVSYGWKKYSTGKRADSPVSKAVSIDTTTCPACRAILPGSSSYCGECGARLDSN